MNIGVLAMQGGIIEHINQIRKLGHNAIEIKNKKDLKELDALIIPGGESTTISKLIKENTLFEALIEVIKAGLPTLGTCAGMILLAKEIEGEEKHLGLLNIKVKRNGFGRQLGSYRELNKIKGIEKEVELVFIRAPYILEVWGECEVICKSKGKVVGVKENNILAIAFHPELTEDLSFMRYFIELAQKINKRNT